MKNGKLLWKSGKWKRKIPKENVSVKLEKKNF